MTPLLRDAGSARIVRVEIITETAGGAVDHQIVTGYALDSDTLCAYPSGWPPIHTPTDLTLRLGRIQGYERRRELPAERVELDEPYVDPFGKTVRPGPPYLSPGPCRRNVAPGEIIADACPGCGHTGLLHPGLHNPALRGCMVCELEDVRDNNPASPEDEEPTDD